MKDKVRAAQDELERLLWNSLSCGAIDYFGHASKIFLEVKDKNWHSYQAAIGNMAICCELMIKTAIVKICPRKLFAGLPDTLDVYLTSKGHPFKDLHMHIFLNDLLEFKYKTIELSSSISIFKILFPDEAKKLRRHFSQLAGIRNVAVHAGIREVRRFDLHQIGYLFYSLYKFCRINKLISSYMRDLSEEEHEFLLAYDHARIQRVTDSFKDAKDRSKSISELSFESSDSDEFDRYTIECPVCASLVIVEGTTELDFSMGSDGMEEQGLTFWPDYFKCDACGLVLCDYRDFALVGLDSAFDRTDDIEFWNFGEY